MPSPARSALSLAIDDAWHRAAFALTPFQAALWVARLQALIQERAQQARKGAP